MDEGLIAGVGYMLFFLFRRQITRRIQRQHDRSFFDISPYFDVILKLKNNNFKLKHSPVCALSQYTYISTLTITMQHIQTPYYF